MFQVFRLAFVFFLCKFTACSKPPSIDDHRKASFYKDATTWPWLNPDHGSGRCENDILVLLVTWTPVQSLSNGAIWCGTTYLFSFWFFSHGMFFSREDVGQIVPDICKMCTLCNYHQTQRSERTHCNTISQRIAFMRIWGTLPSNLFPFFSGILRCFWLAVTKTWRKFWWSTKLNLLN